MEYVAKLYASKPNEISCYLNQFFQVLEMTKEIKKEDLFEWKFSYSNPLEFVDLVNFHQDYSEEFDVTLWISFDIDLFIHVTKENGDEIIRYIYERFPY